MYVRMTSCTYQETRTAEHHPSCAALTCRSDTKWEVLGSVVCRSFYVQSRAELVFPFDYVYNTG